jgi:hypothetical protein
MARYRSNIHMLLRSSLANPGEATELGVRTYELSSFWIWDGARTKRGMLELIVMGSFEKLRRRIFIH